MLKNKTLRNIVLLWLAWVLVLIGYQTWAPRRMLTQRPDYAREWTVSWTTANAQAGKPYLFLSRLGRNEAFDQAWTVASVLLLAVNAYLFAKDMWAG